MEQEAGSGIEHGIKIANGGGLVGRNKYIYIWVERFSVHGSGLKRPNWLLTRKHADKCKCYVSPNQPAKVLYCGQVIGYNL